MAEEIAFSVKWLEQLPAPAARTVYRDSKTPGLELRVTPKGVKTFCSRRRMGKGFVRVTIGRWPVVSLAQARTEALQAASAVASGIDPRPKKQVAPDVWTVQRLWDHWAAEAKPRKKHWREDERLWERFIIEWKDRPIADVKRDDLKAMHARIGATTPHLANRLLSVVSTLYKHAADPDGEIKYDGPSPANLIKRFREQPRERFLQPAELPKFFAALETEPDPLFKDYFLAALLTGQRRRKVCEMRWDELDLDGATWYCPVTKNGDSIDVPLLPQVVAMLRERRKIAPDPWVFHRKDGKGALVEPWFAFQRMLKRAGLKNLRIHDLRRSLASWQTLTGAPLPVVGKTLGHRSATATSIYARANTTTVRCAMAKAAEAMMEAGKAPKASDEQPPAGPQ